MRNAIALILVLFGPPVILWQWGHQFLYSAESWILGLAIAAVLGLIGIAVSRLGLSWKASLSALYVTGFVVLSPVIAIACGAYL